MGTPCCCCPKPTVYNVKFHFRVFPTNCIFDCLLTGRGCQEDSSVDTSHTDTASTKKKNKKRAVIRVQLGTCSATVCFCRNFLVLRPDSNKFVFTIFHKSGHVNVSGVKDFTVIPEVLSYFNSVFKVHITPTQVVVDNSTASGYIQSTQSPLSQPDFLNLHQLHQYISQAKRGTDLSCEHSSGKRCYLSLRPHYFPGGVFKIEKSTCTVILFTTKKYIIVGAKCEKEIHETQRLLCAIICQSLRTSTQVTSSAPTVHL